LGRLLFIQRMLDLTYQRWGRLDVLFNNAGIAEVRQLLELTEDEWDRTLAVNLRAVFFVLQGAAKRMRHQTPIAGSELRGKLIHTASIAPTEAVWRTWSTTQPAKPALSALPAPRRRCWRPIGSLRIASAPGAVDTPMWRKIDAEWSELEGWQIGEAWKRRTSLIPLGRSETPEDMAGVVSFLASRDADYMTGQTVNVDGGLVMGN
jgi:meso-butanediol dehydrogenase / (S,S)-butanediol dehydrogenase / diacetyl reductase